MFANSHLLSSLSLRSLRPRLRWRSLRRRPLRWWSFRRPQPFCRRPFRSWSLPSRWFLPRRHLRGRIWIFVLSHDLDRLRTASHLRLRLIAHISPVAPRPPGGAPTSDPQNNAVTHAAVFVCIASTFQSRSHMPTPRHDELLPGQNNEKHGERGPIQHPERFSLRCWRWPAATHFRPVCGPCRHQPRPDGK